MLVLKGWKGETQIHVETKIFYFILIKFFLFCFTLISGQGAFFCIYPVTVVWENNTSSCFGFLVTDTHLFFIEPRNCPLMAQTEKRKRDLAGTTLDTDGVTFLKLLHCSLYICFLIIKSETSLRWLFKTCVGAASQPYRDPNISTLPCFQTQCMCASGLNMDSSYSVCCEHSLPFTRINSTAK